MTDGRRVTQRTLYERWLRWALSLLPTVIFLLMEPYLVGASENRKTAPDLGFSFLSPAASSLIESIADQRISSTGGAVDISFNVLGPNVSGLNVAATWDSDLLVSAIILGNGTNRILRVTPKFNSSGSCTVTLWGTESVVADHVSFTLVVSAPPGVVPFASPEVLSAVIPSGSTKEIVIPIEDPDDPLDTLTFEVQNDMADRVSRATMNVVDGKAVLHLETTAGASGEGTLGLAISDRTSTVRYIFSMRFDRPGDDPPIIGSLYDRIYEYSFSSELRFSIPFSDPDTFAGAFRYSASHEGNLVDALYFDPNAPPRLPDDPLYNFLAELAVKLRPNARGRDRITVALSDGTSEVKDSFELRINGMSQTISFVRLPTVARIGAQLTLEATASSGLPVSFSVSGPGLITGNILRVIGSGVITVTALQAGDDSFGETSSMQQVFVGMGEQYITFEAPEVLEFRSEPVSLSAISSSGLPVTLEVVSGPASITGNQLTLLSVGRVVVLATQPGDSNYAAAAPLERAIQIARAAQILSFEPPPDSVFGSPAVTLRAQASSGLPVSFELISGPGTLVRDQLSSTAPGIVIVRASQEGNANYAPANPIERSWLVNKVPQSITFNLPAQIFGTGLLLDAVASSGLEVRYEVLSGPAVVQGRLLRISAPGEIRVRASQGGSDTYSAAESVERTLMVPKSKQYITFEPLPQGVTSFELHATSSSGLPVQFSVLSTNAVLAGRTLMITGGGRVMVEAGQHGDEQYAPAEPVVRTVTLFRLPQTIAFSGPGMVRFGDPAVELKGSASSGLSVGFAIRSGPGTLDGNRLMTTGSGEILLTITQAGDEDYLPASIEEKITVRRALQSVEFPPITDLRFGDAPFPLVATASSGLPIAFELISGRARISDGRLVSSGAGPVTVRASQAGDANFEPAIPVDQIVSVAKAHQVIGFDPPAAMFLSETEIVLSPISSSLLPVTMELVSGPAILENSRLVASGPGRVLLRTTQRGNDDYEAAAPVERTVAVIVPGAPLANDYFIAAMPVSGATNVLSVDSYAGSIEPGEPSPGGCIMPRETYWWRFTPDKPGTLWSVSEPPTRGSHAVYKGASLADLKILDAFCETTLYTPVQPGEVYYVQVQARQDPALFGPPFLVNVHLAFVETPENRPVNDDLANATEVSAVNGQIVLAGSTEGSTRERWEGHPTNAFGSLWFKWRAPLTGTLQIKSDGGSSGLQLFTGEKSQRDALHGQSGFVAAGDWIHAAVYTYTVSDFRFTIDTLPPVGPKPPNDDFAHAVELKENDDGTLVISGTSTSGATIEPGENAYLPRSAPSIWFKWTPTLEPGFYTQEIGDLENGRPVIQFFSGTAITNLALAGLPAHYPPNYHWTDTTLPQIREGVTCYIRVSEFITPRPFFFTVHPLVPNDNFADAITLSGVTNYLTGNYRAATLESWELAPGCGLSPRTLWWRFVPEHNGAILSYSAPFGPPFSTHLVLDETRQRIGGDCGKSISLVPVRAGAQYFIQVAPSEFVTPRNFSNVTVRFIERAGNDDFEAALPLVSNSTNIDCNFGASTQVGELLISPTARGNSVWYSWRPSRAGTARLQVAGILSGVETGVQAAIYRGTNFSNLERIRTQLQTTDGAGFIVQPGDNYFFQVDSTMEPSTPFSVTLSFEAFASPQSIQFDSVGDLPFSKQPTTLRAHASSGLPVSFSIVEGPARVSDVSLYPLGTGAVTIRATQNGNEDYQSASVEQSFRIVAAEQTIRIEPLEAVQFGTPPFTLRASASSGLPVSFELLSGPAELNGSLLTVLNTGVIQIRAKQPGDSNYLAAVEENLRLLVVKGLQTILFDPPAQLILDGLHHPLTATASSGLPVTFELLTGPGEILEGTLLHPLGLGGIIVLATQRGDDRFEAAPPEERTITILDRPRIKVSASGSKIILSWPEVYAGLQLEWADDVRGPWRSLLESISSNTVQYNEPESLRFFRLRVPNLR